VALNARCGGLLWPIFLFPRDTFPLHCVRGQRAVFFLYTWPFFLALLPVAVFSGMAISVWQQQKIFLTFLLTLLLVSGSFWGLFYAFVGW